MFFYLIQLSVLLSLSEKKGEKLIRNDPDKSEFSKVVFIFFLKAPKTRFSHEVPHGQKLLSWSSEVTCDEYITVSKNPSYLENHCHPFDGFLYLKVSSARAFSKKGLETIQQ